MTTISVPIPPHLEEFINRQIKEGKASNKAQVVRRAIEHFSEKEAIQAVLDSQQDIRDGKVFRGDLRELVKRI